MIMIKYFILIMCRMFADLLRKSAYASSFRDLDEDYLNLHKSWAYFLGVTLVFASIVYLSVLRFEVEESEVNITD